MITRDIPPIRRRQRITADWLNKVRRAAIYAFQLRFEPPLELINTGSGFLLRLVWTPRKWLRVTGGSNPYAWIEVYSGPSGTWINGFNSGTTTVDPLYEANSNSAIPQNYIVLARRAFGTGTWICQVGTCAATPAPVVTPTSPVPTPASPSIESEEDVASMMNYRHPSLLGPPGGLPPSLHSSTGGTGTVG